MQGSFKPASLGQFIFVMAALTILYYYLLFEFHVIFVKGHKAFRKEAQGCVI